MTYQLCILGKLFAPRPTCLPFNLITLTSSGCRDKKVNHISLVPSALYKFSKYYHYNQ